MTNDEKQRESQVGYPRAVDRDFARKGLVTHHRVKAMGPDAMGSIIHELAALVKNFEYDQKALMSTGDGSLIIAPGQKEFIFPCMAPWQIVDPAALPAGWPLPTLPPGFQFWLYQFSLMEAGKIIRLVLRARYPGGLLIGSTRFYLCRKNPIEAATNGFTQEDILLYNPVLPMAPIHTGPPFPTWATWYDKRTDVVFNYPFDAPPDQNGDQASLINLYIVMERWVNNVPTFPANTELRIDMYIEDRGR
jgi:hypothetical protein